MYTIVLINFDTISFNYTRCLGMYKTMNEAWDYLIELRTDVMKEFGDCNVYEYNDGFGIRDKDDNVLVEAWITMIEE